MSIELPLDNHGESCTRSRLVKIIATTASIATLMTVLTLAHHDITGGWIVNIQSLTAGFRGPYTSVEKITLSSAGFSLLASVTLEGVLFYYVRAGDNKTKLWIRTCIFFILAVNIALALSAFIFTLVDNTMISDLEFTTSATLEIWDKAYRTEEGPSTWSCELTAYQNIRNNTYSVGRICRSRLASRWLSLLIFIFSMILVALAWLDFKDEDSWLRPSRPEDEEARDEKHNILFVKN